MRVFDDYASESDMAYELADDFGYCQKEDEARESLGSVGHYFSFNYTAWFDDCFSVTLLPDGVRVVISR